MIGPVLVEVMVAGIASAFVAGVSGSLVARLRSLFAGRPNRVELKLPSGKVVMLDLDGRLTSNQRSEIVTTAVRLAEAGDEAGLRHVVEQSHMASQSVRELSSP